MKRLLRALLATAIAGVAAAWVMPVTAAAAAVTLAPSPALPGGPLTVQGTDFSPTTTIRLLWNGDYGTAAQERDGDLGRNRGLHRDNDRPCGRAVQTLRL